MPKYTLEFTKQEIEALLSALSCEQSEACSGFNWTQSNLLVEKLERLIE